MTNICRAGLHTFASTTIWLRELGAASPPFLVVLGLTLPDSRILCGIAGIGMTLTNIVIILPHLRQPMLDSIRAIENTPVHQQNSQEHNASSPDGSGASRSAGIQITSLPCVPVKSLAIAPPSNVLDVNSKTLPHTLLLQAAGDTDDGQPPAQVHRPPDIESPENLIIPGNLLMRKGRSALQIPLPVPDTAEVAFFDSADASLSIGDLDLGAESPTCEQYSAPEDVYTMEDDGLLSTRGGQLVAADLPTTPEHAETAEDPTHVELLVTNANTPPVTIKDSPNPTSIGGGTTSPLSGSLAARVETLQSDQAGHSMVREVYALEKRPESLIFVPQSVIRRCPALMLSAERCYAYRGLSSGRDHQCTLAPSHALARDSATPSGGATPQASYDGHWRAAFYSEARPNRQSMKGQTLIAEMPALDFLTLTSLPVPPPVHEVNVLKKYSADRRRFGVLARAGLRNRRPAARYWSNGIHGSSTSDSDSDFDSGSQCSSASSADEDMLPRMLGKDLIAAIDANSEPGINLAAPGRTNHAQPNAHEGFLISEDSAADVSMIMRVSTVSSAEDVSNGEVKVPATFRSLTYEDIQQWASGVVQKCARQVRRSHGPVVPLSPSQASEVCAEKPLGSGISQCPLSGLHCKLGAAALALTPALGTKELPAPLPPTCVLSTRKPLSGRDPRDIPEFVPRQRHVSVMAGGAKGPRRPSTRSTIDVTRDAATEVIARLECQAGFDTRRWFAGVDEARRASRVRGFQGALRCA